MIVKVIIGFAVLFALLAGLFFLFASHRAARATELETLLRTGTNDRVERVSFRRLGELPPPVLRYFRLVLKDGQPMIRGARFTQSGHLRLNPEATAWSSFSAAHTISAERPGFLWKAKITLASPIHVQVLDSYARGVGGGSVALQSAIPMGSDKDHARLNSAALYRYLAEAVWYPTALLPENGVVWRAIDPDRARAELTDSGMTVGIDFTFNERGEIVRMYATERFGKFGKDYVQYPWEGRFDEYEERSGMRIPGYGQVGWHLPSGYWLFWKGRIESARYNFDGNEL